jgi:hypothetical protein
MSRLPNAEAEVVDNLGQPAIPVIDGRTIPRAVGFSLNPFESCRYCDEARARMAVSRASCLG